MYVGKIEDPTVEELIDQFNDGHALFIAPPGKKYKGVDRRPVNFHTFLEQIVPKSPNRGLEGLEKNYLSAKKKIDAGNKDFWMNDHPNASELLDRVYEYAQTIYPPSKENLDIEDIYRRFKKDFEEDFASAKRPGTFYPAYRGDDLFEKTWSSLTSWKKWKFLRNLPDSDELFSVLSKRLMSDFGSELEHDDDAVFGKYAFAPERRRTRSDKISFVPYEENTPIEQKVFDDLKAHKEGKWGKISPDVLRVLKDIQDQELYTDVFPGINESKPIYKGMGVNKGFIVNVIGEEAEELYQTFVASEGISNWGVLSPKLNIDDAFTLEGDWNFDMRSGRTVDSWTSSFDVAQNFAMKTSKGGGGYSFQIVLECDLKDNRGVFIDLSVFDKMLTSNPEDEFISIGDVRVKKIHILYARKK